MAFVLLATRAPASSTPAPATDRLLTEMLDLSGTRRMLEQVPQQVQASALHDQEKLPAAVRSRLQGALAESYRFESLYKTAFEHVRKHATPDELAQAIDLLRSPLVLRFTEYEVQAGTPESAPLLTAFVNKLPYSPPPDARLDLVQRLDDLTATSALLTEVTVQTAAAIARGVSSARAPMTRAQRLALEDAVVQMRREIAPATRQQVLTTFLFSYRKATDADLERYVQLYEGRSGHWLAQVTGTALRHALEQAAIDLARRITSPGAPLAPQK